mgnify:CR=1 FL=1
MQEDVSLEGFHATKEPGPAAAQNGVLLTNQLNALARAASLGWIISIIAHAGKSNRRSLHESFAENTECCHAEPVFRFYPPGRIDIAGTALPDQLRI